MWCIPPLLLCQKHLLGEHAETHMFLGSMEKGISLSGYVCGGLFDSRILQERHDELAVEIDARGGTHMSPLVVPPAYASAWPGRVNETRSLVDLTKRCADCRSRIDAAVLWCAERTPIEVLQEKDLSHPQLEERLRRLFQNNGPWSKA